MSRTVEEAHLNDLDLSTRQALCKKLDIIDNATGGDFNTLGAHLNMSSDDLTRVGQQPKPTESILRWWERKPEATISKLRNVLLAMDRLDCVAILDKKSTKTVNTTRMRLRSDGDEDGNGKGDSGNKRRHSEDEPETSKKVLTRTMTLDELGCTCYDEICLSLNIPVINKDYRALAGRMGYKKKDVDIFTLKNDPTRALLDNWKTKAGNDVEKLIEVLSLVGRDDLVDILRKALSE